MPLLFSTISYLINKKKHGVQNKDEATEENEENDDYQNPNRTSKSAKKKLVITKPVRDSPSPPKQVGTPHQGTQ